MSDAEQVKSQTGFSIGGVSPVAHLNRIKILIDSSLSRHENIYAAAGHPNSIFKIGYKQLIELTKGKEEDIV
jgi:prolyl-tRNA editing enzyme YbaK/EbsC (Cys-tRNA(Pro) deacylase)